MWLAGWVTQRLFTFNLNESFTKNAGRKSCIANRKSRAMNEDEEEKKQFNLISAIGKIIIHSAT